MSLPYNSLSDQALDALIAKERTRIVAPLTEWHTLSKQLRSEGLLRSDFSGEPLVREPLDASSHVTETSFVPPRRDNGILRWGTRLVASAALVGIGVIVGRGVTIGQEVAPAVKQAIQAASMDSMPFETPEQAARVLVKSQTQYQRAAGYLAAKDTSPQIIGGPEMYQERLAALDEVLATTRAKLQEAPTDPVLNQYYQSAIGAREATIQQLGRTLPAGVKIGHY